MISKTDLSVTPDRDFEALYAHWSEDVKRHSCLNGVSQEDREDILSDFWRKVWRVYQDRSEHQENSSLKPWLFTILKNTAIDHWRRRKRLEEKLPSISLHQQIRLKDGETIELGDVLPAPEEDATDWEQREQVLEIAQQCGCNQKQLELLRLRLKGEPLRPEWSQKWINTNWHRIKKLIEEFKANKRGKIP